MDLTGELVDHIADVTFDELPNEVVEMANHVLLDGIGVMLAGYTEPSGIGRTIDAYVDKLGGAEQATVFGSGRSTSVLNAAFANGTMAHALDLDNTWYPLNHPMSPTLPALLALGELHDVTMSQLYEAMVVAFEVQGRLRLASLGLAPGKTFHKPGTTGLMGAAAASAKLMGLSHHETRMALGIAGSRAGSLSINTGTMTKSNHSGHAARMGVEVAMLADLGWTANPEVFGPGGFFDCFMGGDAEPSLLVKDFGRPFRMADPGVGFKRYPCNYYTHRVIDAVKEIRASEEIDPSEVRSIEIRFPRFGHLDRPRPESGLDGKFSVQYCAATAMLDGEVWIDTFTDERRASPDVVEMLERVTLVQTDEITLDFRDSRVDVTVETDGGRSLSATVTKLEGMDGVPLSREQREGKFRACASRVLDDERTEELKDATQGLQPGDRVSMFMSKTTPSEK